MAKTELELDATQDPDLQLRAGGAVDASEALQRKAPPARPLRKGDFDQLPAAMTPSGSDERKLEPVSPAAFGSRLQPVGGTVLPATAPVPPGRQQIAKFSFIVDNKVQGKEAIPCIVVGGKKAFMRSLPLAELGVRMETGRKYDVTVVETVDSTPTLRRLGGTVRV